MEAEEEAGEVEAGGGPALLAQEAREHAHHEGAVLAEPLQKRAQRRHMRARWLSARRRVVCKRLGLHAAHAAHAPGEWRVLCCAKGGVESTRAKIWVREAWMEGMLEKAQ